MRTKKKKITRLTSPPEAALILLEEARKKHPKKIDEQLEYLRWLRDVIYNGQYKIQMACAIAIDKVKGHY